MLKKLSIVVCIFIFLLILILGFANLFAMRASYFILFWKVSGSITWLIIGTFLLGFIFGISLFTFLSSGEILEDNDVTDSDSEWG